MPRAVRHRRRLERRQSTSKQLNQPKEKDRKEHWEPTSPVGKKKTLDGCGDLHVNDADMLRSVPRRGSEGGRGRGKRTSWSVDRPGRKKGAP